MTLTQTRAAGPDRRRARRHRRSRWNGRPIVVIGVVLVVAGLVVLGYVGWQFLGTNLVAHRHQEAEKQDIESDWAVVGTTGDASGDRWSEGSGIALVRIPRFGDDYEMPLLAGASETNLARGIAWFPETARPGQVGNFVIAAHRVTHGEPFSRFLDLEIGDDVVVETRTHVYTYRLSEDGDARVVDLSETWVLDPVPGKPEATPEQSLITLVTCAEIFHTDDRNVVFGVLQSAERKPLEEGEPS